MKTEKNGYINYTVEEKEKASGIAVLSSGNHEVNVAVLYEHVGDAVIVYDWILRLCISLHSSESRFIENRTGEL